MEKEIYKVLKETFGYSEFRGKQKEVILNVLAGKDTLAVMPTSMGKSLCYQIPAIIFEGLTVVVSPLISLMQDQVDSLKENGVPAVVLNSSISTSQYNESIDMIANNQVKLLFVAPETLILDKTQNLLQSVEVKCIAIDEAHCISEWGHDFRPEYREIGYLRSFFPGSVCVALTATATRRVREDIVTSLKKHKTFDTFLMSFNRENLFIEVVEKNNPLEQVLTFIKKYPDESGIIYCFSRKQVDQLTQDLKDSGLKVLPYHAGLSDDERKENQNLFIRDDVQIIVATIAFGMGINKSNVRFIVHYDIPKNIESYYQQIGRAGRDGLKSFCLLLFSYGDINKVKYFINNMSENEKKVANKHLNSMISFVETYKCRRKPILNYFGEEYDVENCGFCDNCLKDDVELKNISVQAQKFLSCVKRSGEIFGAIHIVDILRGSNNKKVLDNGHDNLSTYGIGKDFSQKQWMHFFRQFLSQGIIVQTDKHGSLKLNRKSWEVFRGNIEVLGVILEEKPKISKKTASKKPLDIYDDYDMTLYKILVNKRKEIADIQNVPAYVVFSNKSLIEMCIYFPESKNEFLQINGVGNAKYDKYGEDFMGVIKEYLSNRK